MSNPDQPGLQFDPDGSTAELGRILEDSINETFIFDAETLRFRYVNRTARENLGYTMAELQELSPLDLKPQFTSDSFAELLKPLRSGEQHTLLFKTQHRRKDESYYPVEVHLELAAFRGSLCSSPLG